MSKYRIKVEPRFYFSGDLATLYLVQKKVFGIYWLTLKECFIEEAAREYIANAVEFKKRKVKFIDVVEEE